MSADRWRERVWQVLSSGIRIGLTNSPSRAAAKFGSIAVHDMGVGEPWGVQACSGTTLPTSGDLAAARQWCAERGGSNWIWCSPAELADSDLWQDFDELERVGLYAIDAAVAAQLPVEIPSELTLEYAPTYEQVIAGYSTWIDEALARKIVAPADLAETHRRFIVGVVDGVAIGTAFVWWIDGTAHLQGIGVAEAQRGKGYGKALTIAASVLAATGAPDGAPDIVWMGATDDGAALYERLGYVRVDTEVQLTPKSA